MGTSLNELKTGREKLEIINNVLARIASISEAIDNTRLDEIIGLKQACEALKNECLKYKNDITNKNDDITGKYSEIHSKYSKIIEHYNDIKTKFDFISEAYNDFSLNREEVTNIKNFLENNREEFENLRADIQKYEEMKFSLDGYIRDVEQGKDFVREYLELNLKIKDSILAELNHALEIVENLHLNVDELKEIRPELLNIKKEVRELASEAGNVVSEASMILKNKINTIFFENQRLNLEMIEGVKKLIEINNNVNEKHEFIVKAYDLLTESRQNLENLNEVIRLYKGFENDIASHAQIIQDFRNQIESLEQDLSTRADAICGTIDLKGEEVLNLLGEFKNTASAELNNIIDRGEEIKARIDRSSAEFDQRAELANADLGQYAEVARVELGKDKLVYETELRTLKDEILSILNGEKSLALNVLSDKKQELLQLVNTSEATIRALSDAFEDSYQEKREQMSTFLQEGMHNFNQNKEQSLRELELKKSENDAAMQQVLEDFRRSKENSLSELQTKKDAIDASMQESLNNFNQNKEQSLSELDNKKAECVERINTQAQELGINEIKTHVEGILSLIQNHEDTGQNIQDSIAQISEEVTLKKAELEEVKRQIEQALSQEPPLETSALESQKQALEAQIETLEQNKRAQEAELEQIRENKNLVNKETLHQGLEGLKQDLQGAITQGDTALKNELSQLNTSVRGKVSLSGNETINGNKTFTGATTFNNPPVSNQNPSADDQLARKSYVDTGGGILYLGAVGATNLDLTRANHFSLHANAGCRLGISNFAAAGKSGTITVYNAQNLAGFNAPFNFRVAQSGFNGTEVFAYLVIANNYIRLARA